MVDEVGRCGREIADSSEFAPLHDAVSDGLSRLSEPLRVAVCGQLSAGKSTLVNSLIGARLAQTGSEETTEANWWFRADERERVAVRRPGGGVEVMALPPDGSIPPLGEVDLDRDDAIQVWLDNDTLRGLTVIDTPGLFSPRAERSERAQALLRDRTTRAASRADALVYVTSEVPGAQRDVAELRAFQELFGSVAKPATNALLVLTKVDGWWKPSAPDGPDPLALGQSLLDGHRSELRRRVWDAVPVIGLLAETTRTRTLFDASLIADLRSLAASPDAPTMLLSHSLFHRARAEGVDETRRRELSTCLGVYGVATCLELVRNGCDDPEQLRAALDRRSGFARVRDLIDRTFRERSAVLRADALLTTVERAALSRPIDLTEGAADRARGLVEGVRAGRHGSELRALGVLRELANRGVAVTDAQRVELRRLFGEHDIHARVGPVPAGLSASEFVRRRRNVWRAIEVRRPSPAVNRRIGSVAREAYENLLAELELSAPSDRSNVPV